MQAEPEAPRLLWLTERYAPSRGGMAVSCDRIVHALRQRGAWVDLVHLSRAAEVATHEIRENGSDRVLPAGSEAAHALAALWPELKDMHGKEEGPGWTHVVAFGGAVPCAAGSAYAAWLGVPLVILLRGNDFDTGVFWPERRAALDDAIRRAACIGCVTEDLRHRVQRLFPGVNAVWTPNGIDCEEWRALPSDLRRAAQWRAANVEPHKKIVGLFGDLKAKKGVETLLAAIASAKAGGSVHLLVAGAPPEGLDARLPAGLGASMLPAMPRTDLIPYLLACDAVALPSLYEGFPNLLLEAAALGVPMIASEAGGAGVLRDGAHGVLFRSGDMEDCSHAIERFVAARPREIQAWRAACRRLSAEFSLERECERYLGLFTPPAAMRASKVARLPAKGRRA